MNPASEIAYLAFEGDRGIASGELRDVISAAKATLDRRNDASILVFDGRTGAPIDIDFRGSGADGLARLPDLARASTPAAPAAQPAPRGPRPPKPGVVAPEGTPLP